MARINTEGGAAMKRILPLIVFLAGDLSPAQCAGKSQFVRL